MNKTAAAKMIDDSNIVFEKMVSEDAKAFLKNILNATDKLSNTGTLNFGSTAAQTSADLTITVTGAVVGQSAKVVPPLASMQANTLYSAHVSAADTVTVRFHNYSAGAIDPASGSFLVIVE
jgi:hypothetical protein